MFFVKTSLLKQINRTPLARVRWNSTLPDITSTLSKFEFPRSTSSIKHLEEQKRDFDSLITCNGWIDRKPKKLGKALVFGSLRDINGDTIQLVDSNVPSLIRSLKQESAVSITGKLKERHSVDGKNKSWDLTVEKAVTLNEANDVGSQLFTGNTKEWPQQYRYLQLRSPYFQKIIKSRSHIMKTCRKVLDDLEFTEVDTPLLFKSTPEGAREFLIPTRKNGLMYALPQSPQQYKQLLMASGIHKYYQIAKCFRDEDLRQDRQPEFTQLDMEMSFSNGEDVRNVIEKVIKAVWKDNCQPIKVSDVETRSPVLYTLNPEDNFESLIPITPDNMGKDLHFTSITYNEAISRFGIDKPDVRSSFEIIDLQKCGVAKATENEAFTVFEVMVIPNALSLNNSVKNVQKDVTNELIQKITDKNNYKSRIPNVVVIRDQKTLDTWTDEFSGMAQFTVGTKELNKILNLKIGDIIAGSTRAAINYENPTPLGKLRSLAIESTLPHGLYSRKISHTCSANTQISNSVESDFAVMWVVDFPLFNPVEVEQELVRDSKIEQDAKALYPKFDYNKYVSTHHPFTMCNVSDYELLDQSPLSVRGQHYDLVMNGVELGGGSTRIHDTELQKFIFEKILKIKNYQILFGHLLKAFDTGCPPHAGLAIGFDRMVAMLNNTDSIRNVIAFPKSITGSDLMIGSPSKVTETQLRPYHIKCTK